MSSTLNTNSKTQATQLDDFKEHLEAFKERTGMDIEVDDILKGVKKSQDPNDPIEYDALALARLQVDKLIKDWEEFHGKKGLGLEIMVRIKKENYADTFGEQWILGDKQNIKVISLIEIGTKGKYQKFEGLNSR